MLGLLIATALAATATDTGPARPLVAVPMTKPAWDAMTPAQRRRYAQATVDALRRSRAFASCEALSADALEIRIDEAAASGEPLIMAVAAAAYTICDETAGG